MRIPEKSILCLILVAAGVVCAGAADRKFEPRVVIPRAFAAITNAPVLSADKASDGVVRSNELVLGVVVNGKARAYPINMLTGPKREIINDDLGGKAIAATW